MRLCLQSLWIQVPGLARQDNSHRSPDYFLPEKQLYCELLSLVNTLEDTSYPHVYQKEKYSEDSGTPGFGSCLKEKAWSLKAHFGVGKLRAHFRSRYAVIGWESLEGTPMCVTGEKRLVTTPKWQSDGERKNCERLKMSRIAAQANLHAFHFCLVVVSWVQRNKWTLSDDS